MDIFTPMEMIKEAGKVYIWVLYYRYKVVYVGLNKEFNNKMGKVLVNKKYDGIKAEKVNLAEGKIRRAELVAKYEPVYNKRLRKKIKVVPVVISLKDKLAACKKMGISLMEYEKLAK